MLHVSFSCKYGLIVIFRTSLVYSHAYGFESQLNSITNICVPELLRWSTGDLSFELKFSLLFCFLGFFRGFALWFFPNEHSDIIPQYIDFKFVCLVFFLSFFHISFYSSILKYTFVLQNYFALFKYQIDFLSSSLKTKYFFFAKLTTDSFVFVLDRVLILMLLQLWKLA